MKGTFRRSVGLAIASALVLGVTTVALARVSSSSSVKVTIPNFSTAQLNSTPAADWVSPAGNLFGQRHSSLNQITPSNVSGLKQAWHTQLNAPDVGDPVLQLGGEAAQIAYKGMLFSQDKVGRVYANDATTGNQLWYYEPNTARIANMPAGANEPGPWASTRGVAINNGVVYAEEQQGNVVALDAKTGHQIWAHTIANVNLGVGLSQAPLYYDGMILGATSGGDTGFSCIVFALDAKTGKPLWHFNLIPTNKRQPGYDTWAHPLPFNGGGAVWATLSVDSDAGLVYIPTGNPIPYAEGRGPGKNYFTDGLLALHLKTGRLAWFFQQVHHDVWDFDNSQQPILYDLKYKGKLRHAIVSANKDGLVYIHDRVTGTPIFPVKEMKVDQSALSHTWATQPIPAVDPLNPQQPPDPAAWAGLTAPDGKPFNLGSNPTGPAATFTAIDSTQYSVSSRNGAGATSARPASVDPTTGMLIEEASPGFNATESLPASELKLNYFNFTMISGRKSASMAGTPAAAVASSRLEAMNLATGKIVWKVDHFDSTNVTGQPLVGFTGGVITTPGLIWTSSSNQLQAYSEANGQLLWSSPTLAGSPKSVPTTYSVKGKQYVTILVAVTGDLYAFSMP
jgi:quinohemoprotein ethanol dehydrogenase